MLAQFIYCSVEMSITANNRRSGGQRFHGILFGRFNGRSGCPVGFDISCRYLHINWINRTYKGPFSQTLICNIFFNSSNALILHTKYTIGNYLGYYKCSQFGRFNVLVWRWRYWGLAHVWTTVYVHVDFSMCATQGHCVGDELTI